ncbi:MAG: hypothetical protein ACR2HG_00325 [Pyrinomonadaceae bacterium]
MSVWSVPTKYYISSTTGWGISASTPFAEISVGYNWLNMTLCDTTNGGRSIILRGDGGSCGVGGGIFPVTANLADANHVTLNNRVYTYPNKNLKPEDFVGMMDVYSANVLAVSTLKRSSMVIYFLESGFMGNLGWSVKAAAIVYSESQATDFAQVGLESSRYNMKFV